RGELLGTSLPFALDGDGTVEVSVRRPDGERLCELRAVATTWQREPATLAAIRDISERKNTEAMREAVRLKAEFLANMSHELRTPLNAIIGFSELLAEPAVNADAEKRTTYIGHVLTSARHLVRLINDVLDLAKVDAGKLVFIAEQTRLDMIMREVADSLGSLAAQAGAEIVVTADDTANDVYLDPVRLKQVLYNYLSNALKVAPKGTRVVVRSLPDRDGRVRIEVEDAGAGIPPDQLPRLFAEFQQLTTGSTTAHQGTGLGLSLTKRIVEAQGGTVGVASVVGKGSTFFAVLPRRATSAAPN
ncbi:MAG TPA: HAMP domain-containing sensor histidine kinase, partial [Myxococcota bacterium]|nr:HAMP domain-containing sensor histidine kinase [Myxococcota bacterium]